MGKSLFTKLFGPTQGQRLDRIVRKFELSAGQIELEHTEQQIIEFLRVADNALTVSGKDEARTLSRDDFDDDKFDAFFGLVARF